jgi:O-acetylserine/cysteine efflux transporter
VTPWDIALLVGVTVVWGINFAVVKAGLLQMPPIFFVALRFVVVALVLAPFLRLPARGFGRLLALSFTLGALHFSLMFVGLRSLDVATAAIAIQLQVPIAALLAALFFGDRLGWRRLLGMAAAFAGVALIAGEPRFEGDLLPLALVVAAACVWSVANIQIKQLGDDVEVLALNGWVALLGAPQLLIVSLLIERGQIAAMMAADWQVWGAIAYQTLLVTVFGYGIWTMPCRFPINQAAVHPAAAGVRRCPAWRSWPAADGADAAGGWPRDGVAVTCCAGCAVAPAIKGGLAMRRRSATDRRRTTTRVRGRAIDMLVLH